jgi:hypothetical protein
MPYRWTGKGASSPRRSCRRACTPSKSPFSTEAGNGELFLRDLALKKSDWFTVGIADLTLSANKTERPGQAPRPDSQQYSDDLNLQGRLAFYTKGKFGDGWRLTASADTREGPLDEIFSNFMDKSPDALFRRIDPDYHYPTFGDDSTVTEDAPTSGKFYLKLSKKRELRPVGQLQDRLYRHLPGARGPRPVRRQPPLSDQATPPASANSASWSTALPPSRGRWPGATSSAAPAARSIPAPAGRPEGSERVRIEIRDKDSGLVLGVKNLSPALDYDIDYLQGRILLSQPLSGHGGRQPAGAKRLLQRPSGLPGGSLRIHPRFDDLDTLATAGRVHYWFNDHVKLGLTASQQEDGEGESNLTARM